jgi:hypothetical protein
MIIYIICAVNFIFTFYILTLAKAQFNVVVKGINKNVDMTETNMKYYVKKIVELENKIRELSK